MKSWDPGRLFALVAATLAAANVHAAPTSDGVDAGASFHLERPSAIDDVFGDSSDYRRTVDRFLDLTAHMQSMRDEFARAVQGALSELNSRAVAAKGKHGCPTDQVALPYARARRMGADYLRVGRELTRHWEVVKEYDHLGESIGLTPDYRWKVRRVLQQYQALLVDYREMKVALHDQLDDELKYAGCDLNALVLKGDPKLASAGDEHWPQPGAPGAPGVLPGKGESPPKEALPPSLPSEKVVQPPIPLPTTRQVTAPADPVAQPRSGILFYVDNGKCRSRPPCISTARSWAKFRPPRASPFRPRPARTISVSSTTPPRSAARPAPCAAAICRRAGPSRFAASKSRPSRPVISPGRLRARSASLLSRQI